MTILPKSRLVRGTLLAVAILGALAVLWFWVFPWADRTFVNRPELGLLRLLR